VNQPIQGTSSSSPQASRTSAADPVAIRPTPPAIQGNWYMRRRAAARGWHEQYRPAPLYKRIFSLASLAAIGLIGGVLIAASIGALIAGAAILMSSIVS
jgi:hypothetical protein